MAAIESVVLIGATGNLGTATLQALTAAGFRVTVLTRADSPLSTSPPPAGAAAIVTANYTSADSLTRALKSAHADAVVSTIGSAGLGAQPLIIEAAVAAGVRRFVPSEFGCDTWDPKCRALPVYKGKVATTDLLVKLAGEGRIEWTTVHGGPFLDWGLRMGMMGNDVAGAKATIYDGGVHAITCTTLEDYGKAVAGALKTPEETKNKAVYVQTARVSQKELMGLVEQVSGSKLEPVEVDTAALEQKAYEGLKKGDFSGMGLLIRRAIFAEGYGSDFEQKQQNELVGVKEVDGDGLVQIVKQSLSS